MFLFDNYDNRNLQWNLKPEKFAKESKENYGGKMILPHNILELLVATNAKLPYVFEISHTNGVYRTNGGCLEFTGHTNTVVVPEWMYQQLDMADMTVTIKYINLPQGRFVRLLPHSVKFLDIENPKLELEKSLRDYQVLTVGDEILCKFEEIGHIRFTVSDTEPENTGIYIVDTDLSVEFLPPLGYEEKIESERTILKYAKIDKDYGNDLKRVKFDVIGVCFDFSSLNE